ncbi:ATP-dependent DNA helicase PIF5-like [Hydractinia symbiolongicarpus]|uniref:ATP-dependent DNA helicase PIF5-like n=1 Tax=Hydractinia symbiolongicarpus TaxID=13093 RepID=UPI00254BB7E6|nr:ATP-dependent DNA helicase PIF5-like [Hydractinia symbiolongicarpus]
MTGLAGIKKILSAIRKVEVTPLYIFLTGAGGCGKSHLIKTIYQAMSKVLSYKSKNLNKPKVFLVAPTGVAAININGTTIHTAFGIPVGHFGKNLPRLNDKRRSTLRNKLSELKAIIVDEISMVSNLQLFYIHLRLIEIFACRDEIPFAGITVIACGDLYQLPPVQQRPVYADYKSDWLNLVHLWKLFEFAELTEVMRQKGDNVLIDLLNNVRIGKLDKKDEELLKNRVVSPNDSDYPANALHIFAENAPAKVHNNIMLESVDAFCFTIQSIDQLPKNVAKGIIEKALNRNQSETGGLATELKIKVGARVMLTVNIDIADRLINGQIGTVKHVKADNANKVSKIYVLFDDPKAGKEAIFKSNCSNRWVPIERAEANIKLKTSKDTSPVIKRTQFPLMLSWACTVHKVKGLTLDKVVISFDLEKQRSFNNGQMYVALSRVTSLNGMCLTGKFSRSAIKCNSRATLEYDRLRNECVFQQIQKFSAPSHDVLTIALLNTRSFSRHAVDISFDAYIV